MSYCRRSSKVENWFDCDVYVYQRGDGMTIVVERYRYIIESFPEEPENDGSPEYKVRFAEYFEEVCHIAKNSPTKPIGLPHDGEHFLVGTKIEAARLLIMLWDEGYQIPADVIETLIHEHRYPED